MAMIDLGISSELFYSLTLCEFAYLLERKRVVLEREVDAPAALIASMLANVHRDQEKHPEPFELRDFLLGRDLMEEEATDQEVATYDDEQRYKAEMFNRIRWLNLMNGGTEDPALVRQIQDNFKKQ